MSQHPKITPGNRLAYVGKFWTGTSSPFGGSVVNLRHRLTGRVLFAVLAALCLGALAQQQSLPEGKGVHIVRAKCLSCHEADLIVQQRLTRAGWVREVEKMMRWGTEATGSEKESMIDYLAANFGSRPGDLARMTAEDRGVAIFKRRCLSCHEADLTEQQRLTRAGWVREVDKMIRWGAEVSDGEKEPLLDYLSRHFGPRVK